jgi:hypothetical protein
MPQHSNCFNLVLFLAYAAMEQQLETLGVRWTAVCQWAEQRGMQLNKALKKWQLFDDRRRNFAAWLTETEESLNEIERRRHSIDDLQSADISDIVEQVQCLKVCVDRCIFVCVCVCVRARGCVTDRG